MVSSWFEKAAVALMTRHGRVDQEIRDHSSTLYLIPLAVAACTMKEAKLNVPKKLATEFNRNRLSRWKHTVSVSDRK